MLKWDAVGCDISEVPDPDRPGHILGRVTRVTAARWLWRAYDEVGEVKGESESFASAKGSVQNVIGSDRFISRT